jgi:hypothetical protein
LFRGDVGGCHRTHSLSLQRFRDPAAPWLRRVPTARFPALIATTSCSDFRPLLPLPFVSFGLRYRPVPPVRSWRGRHPPPGLGSFYVASLTTWLLAETAGSPRFLGNPCARALLSDPGGTLQPGHYGFRMLSSARRTSSTPTVGCFRGSITRPMPSLSTLRRVGHPSPRKTRFRLLACFAGRGLLPPRWVPMQGFRLSRSSFLPAQAWPGALPVHPLHPRLNLPRVCRHAGRGGQHGHPGSTHRRHHRLLLQGSHHRTLQTPLGVRFDCNCRTGTRSRKPSGSLLWACAPSPPATGSRWQPPGFGPDWPWSP